MTKKKSTRRPGLSHEKIVSAATELIDREGADALSARRLASELGVEAMSLYHHVGSMPELVDEVVDQALGTLPLPTPRSRSARADLRRMARAYLDLAGARPHTFRVVGTRRWRTPAELTFQSRMIELLILTGLTPRESLRVARIVLVYVNGAGLAIAGWTLEPNRPVIESAPPVVRRVMSGASPRSLADDVIRGLDQLVDMLVPTR